MGQAANSALYSARLRFVEGLPARAEELSRTAERLASVPHDLEAVAMLRRRLHALLASAQVFEERALTLAAQDLIARLDVAQRAQRPFTVEEIDAIGLVVASLPTYVRPTTPPVAHSDVRELGAATTGVSVRPPLQAAASGSGGQAADPPARGSASELERGDPALDAAEAARATGAAEAPRAAEGPDVALADLPAGLVRSGVYLTMGAASGASQPAATSALSTAFSSRPPTAAPQAEATPARRSQTASGIFSSGAGADGGPSETDRAGQSAPPEAAGGTSESSAARVAAAGSAAESAEPQVPGAVSVAREQANHPGPPLLAPLPVAAEKGSVFSAAAALGRVESRSAPTAEGVSDARAGDAHATSDAGARGSASLPAADEHGAVPIEAPGRLEGGGDHAPPGPTADSALGAREASPPGALASTLRSAPPATDGPAGESGSLPGFEPAALRAALASEGEAELAAAWTTRGGAAGSKLVEPAAREAADPRLGASVLLTQTVSGLARAAGPAKILLVTDAAGPSHGAEAAASDALEVVRSSGGDEAIRALRKHTPEAVLVTAELASSPRADLVRRLKGDPLTPARRVFVLLAEGATYDDAFLQRSGADGVLREPLTAAGLRAVLGEAASQRPARTPEATIDEIAAQLADEIRRGIAESLRVGTNERVPIGDGSEVMAAAWSALGRVRSHLAEQNRSRREIGASSRPPSFSPAPRSEDSAAAPAAEAAVSSSRPPERTRSIHPAQLLSGSRVLIADDDPAILWFFAGLLREAAAQVLQAHNGREALELARRKQPHVIVSDILMPKLDGFGLCREIRRDVMLSRVPVILLSWKDDLLQQMQQLEAGATGYLRKEAGSQEILRQLAEALAPRGRLIQELRGHAAVHGAIEDHGVPGLLEAVAAERPDARLTIRDARNMFEVDVRGGRRVFVTRTAADGVFTRGDKALLQLLGVAAGSFEVQSSAAPVRTFVAEPLDRAVHATGRRLSALLDAVHGARALRIAAVTFDEDALQSALHDADVRLGELVGALRAGTTVETLVRDGAFQAAELEALLSGLVRAGAVQGLTSAAGEDLVLDAQRERETPQLALLSSSVPPRAGSGAASPAAPQPDPADRVTPSVPLDPVALAAARRTWSSPPPAAPASAAAPPEPALARAEEANAADQPRDPGASPSEPAPVVGGSLRSVVAAEGRTGAEEVSGTQATATSATRSDAGAPTAQPALAVAASPMRSPAPGGDAELAERTAGAQPSATLAMVAAAPNSGAGAGASGRASDVRAALETETAVAPEGSPHEPRGAPSELGGAGMSTLDPRAAAPDPGGAATSTHDPRGAAPEAAVAPGGSTLDPRGAAPELGGALIAALAPPAPIAGPSSHAASSESAVMQSSGAPAGSSALPPAVTAQPSGSSPDGAVSADAAEVVTPALAPDVAASSTDESRVTHPPAAAGAGTGAASSAQVAAPAPGAAPSPADGVTFDELHHFGMPLSQAIARARDRAEGLRLLATLVVLAAVGYFGWQQLKPQPESAVPHVVLPQPEPSPSRRSAPASTASRSEQAARNAVDESQAPTLTNTQFGRVLPYIDSAHGVSVPPHEGLLVVEYRGTETPPNVRVGDRDLGRPPLAVPLAPGRHELVLRSGANTSFRYLIVRAGETRVITLPLGDL